MLSIETLIKAPTFRATTLKNQGNRYVGKVRDVYDQGDRLLLVSTDRFSAFDRVLGAIPYHGQVLNQLSGWWFEQTADIVANHLISIPDPTITLARKATALPVEVIVRGYITGVTSTSLWTLYSAGETLPYGLKLQPGLQKNARLSSPVITPTTKADAGQHDAQLSEVDVVAGGYVSAARWKQIREIAIALFERGQRLAEEAGLILVDTKYEFGLIEDELVLIDEVHTPDSSRYWTATSYDHAMARGVTPDALSKEVLREWFVAQGFSGSGPIPPPPARLLAEVAQRYMQVWEALTGEVFNPAAQPTAERIDANLKAVGLAQTKADKD